MNLKSKRALQTCGQQLPLHYGSDEEDVIEVKKKFKCPRSKVFKQIDEQVNQHFQRFTDGYAVGIRLYEAIPLAEIALRSRGLIGLVLGSKAKKLLDPPDNIEELHQPYSDLDILILNKYSSGHPAPMEWGIDWFVRCPANSSCKPTNGYVKLWYDLALKETIKTTSKPRKPNKKLPFFLDTESMDIHYQKPERDLTHEIIGQTRAEILSHIYEPGLYLPSPTTIRKIVNHANDTSAKLPKMIEHLQQKLHNSYKLTPKNARSEVFKMVAELRIISELMGLKMNMVNLYLELGQAQTWSFYSFMAQVEKIFMSRLNYLTTFCNSRKTDYSYLLPEKETYPNALFPVLHDEVLDFTPNLPQIS